MRRPKQRLTRPLPQSFLDTLKSLVANRAVWDIALAVSGGRDSLAMVSLFKTAAEELSLTLHPVTVDHGLRPESPDEARRVGEIMASWGLSHTILTGTICNTGNTLAAARELRYTLLNRFCEEKNVPVLALAHTLDDQRETFFHHLQRGSGLRGLKGMSLIQQRGSLEVWRPLLAYSRDEITTHLNNSGIFWIDDPTNTNEEYFRGKFRKSAPIFEELGLDIKTIALTQRHLSEVENDLHRMVLDCLESSGCQWSEFGHVRLRHEDFRKYFTSIRKRLLQHILAFVTQDETPLRLHTLNELCDRLSDQDKATLTAQGGLIFAHRKDLYFSREPSAMPVMEISAGDSEILYDNFWQIGITGAPENLEIRALGEAGWQQVARRIEPPAALPRRLFYSLPALWHLDAVIAVPHLKYENGAGVGVTIAAKPAKPLRTQLINLDHPSTMNQTARTSS